MKSIDTDMWEVNAMPNWQNIFLMILILIAFGILLSVSKGNILGIRFDDIPPFCNMHRISEGRHLAHLAVVLCGILGLVKIWRKFFIG